MTRASRLALSLLALSACGFPRPSDVAGDDMAGSGSADDPPGSTLHVAPTGDDANDGLTQPVKTLKRALGLAATSDQITSIMLAGGHYAADTGEAFPYTVRSGLVIHGPTGGGAVLAGAGVEVGLSITAAQLQDLELEDFATAITATGTASLTNLRVRDSALALRGDASAQLTVDTLDITGTATACATGILLADTATLTIANLASRGLGSTLESNDQTTATLTNANLTGDPSCPQPVVKITTSEALTIKDSLIHGGASGLYMFPKSGGLRVSVSGTTLQGFMHDGLDGDGSVMFLMTGGELSQSLDGAQFSGGAWTFTDVVLRENHDLAMYMQSGSLTMRGCSIVSNGSGIAVQDPQSVNLGTPSSAGNNVIQNNSSNGLDYNAGLVQIEAVGNTWNPGIQGADVDGHYPTPALIRGPTAFMPGQNYAVHCDPDKCSMQL